MFNDWPFNDFLIMFNMFNDWPFNDFLNYMISV